MRKTATLTAVGLVGVFIGVAFIVAALSDSARTEDHVVLDEAGPVVPVAALGPATTASENSDVGSHAVVAPALVPLPPPLLPGEPSPVALSSLDVADPPASTVATPTTPVTPQPAPDTSTATTLDTNDSPTAIADPAVASPDFGTIYRFFDLCADEPVADCPVGVGGTVLFGGGSAPTPPLDVDIFTEPTQAIRDQVRCDLAWPSSTVIPVLVTSNQPLSTLHTKLLLGTGQPVDNVVNQRSVPSETDWYDQRVQSGQPVGTAVGDGVHTCLEFDLEGPVAPPDVDRNGYFEAEISAWGESSHDALVRGFFGNHRAGKPPVRIVPQDGYRATLIVPQRKDDTVAVTLFTMSQDHGLPGRGECPTNPSQNSYGFLTPRNPATGPTAFPAAQLASPGYPFDRDYSHYKVWDLYLQSGEDYVLCVSWDLDGAREHWVMQTPASWTIQIYGDQLGYNRTVPEGSLLLRVPGINGCWVANPGLSYYGNRPFPEVTLKHSSGWETWWLPDPNLCNSGGWRLPDTIEIEARLSAFGDDTLYGLAQVPLDVLLNTCVFRSPSGTSAGCDGPTVEWRLQKVLCGGPISTGSCGGPDITLTTEILMTPDRDNLSPDPKSWSISQIAIADFDDAGELVTDRLETTGP